MVICIGRRPREHRRKRLERHVTHFVHPERNCPTVMENRVMMERVVEEGLTAMVKVTRTGR
jgi:hypothetical protein